jgi:type IV pilus assembly protein PilY1
MNTFSNPRVLALALWCGFAITPLQARADDIDIFLGRSGGTAAAPKVVIMLDNSSSDLFAAKLDGISAVLDTIVATSPVAVGLAMWSPTIPAGATKGAYIRFAPRDMSIAANKTALKNILTLIKNRNEYLDGIKNEPEAFYEILFRTRAFHRHRPPRCFKQKSKCRQERNCRELYRRHGFRPRSDVGIRV